MSRAAPDGSVTTDRAAEPGQFINPQGCEARAGEALLTPGKRLGFADIALLATVGKAQVAVCARPRVALLATGDEIVAVTETPRDFQIRNSNVYSLAAQVARAGGVPEILPVAKDEYEDTRRLLERGLAVGPAAHFRRRVRGKVRHCGARARRSRRGVLL